MVDWIKVIIGAVGTVGVVLQMPTDIGSWLIGAAFLILGISGFLKD